MSDREEMFEEDDGSDDEQALFGAPGGDGARMFLDADQMLRHRRERQAAPGPPEAPAEAAPVQFLDADHLLRHRRERQAAPGPPAAPAQAAPVQEAARVANPQTQRLHVPRCAGVPTLEWLSFLKYVIEEGFGFVEHDMHGAVYERVRE